MEATVNPVHVSGCPFCPDNGMVKIVADEGIAYLVLARDAPVEGCYLLVPRSHVIDMQMLPDMWQGAANRLMNSIPWFVPGVTAYNLSLNLGKRAGQTLPHLHFWVIPRNENPRSPSIGLGAATLIQRLNDAT